MLDREWNRLVDQIKRGDCTPFLGAGACAGTLPSGKDLSEVWADRYEYPFENRGDLADVMQYAGTIEMDPVTVKQHVSDYLLGLGAPDLEIPSEPHALLARFPIDVYLTTNYDDFMTQALQRAGRNPKAVVCPWYRGADDSMAARLSRDYQPQADTPLVYHLHGSLQDPSSLVLTERDYSEFLVRLFAERGLNQRRVIPAQVLHALTTRPLLFIGYSLRDSSFRTLFHGLVRSVAGVQQRRHVSVQLPPSEELGVEARGRGTRYLNRYFNDLNISVYWGTVSEFCAELSHRLESS